MKGLCLCVVFLVFCWSKGFCQNLVPNGSFEDTVSCPFWLGDFTAQGWTSPNSATPDFFHPCSSNASAPQNVFGFQSARTGNAYTGILLSDFSNNEYREYIQCQFSTPLIVGKSYCVTFFVSRTDSCTKACNNIGAYLSATSISSLSNENLPYSPQVLNDQNNPITNDSNWVIVTDTIISSGGEQFLTIGVFSNNANTSWIPVPGGWELEAHYYIDDVSVIEVLPTSILEGTEFHITLFPNPSEGILNVNSNEKIDNCRVYSSDGKLIINHDSNKNNLQIDLSDYPDGLYFIDLKANDFITRKKVFILH